jgi:hypothetical protein
VEVVLVAATTGAVVDSLLLNCFTAKAERATAITASRAIWILSFMVVLLFGVVASTGRENRGIGHNGPLI